MTPPGGGVGGDAVGGAEGEAGEDPAVGEGAGEGPNWEVGVSGISVMKWQEGQSCAPKAPSENFR